MVEMCIVLFKIDGIDTVRVFSNIDLATKYCRTIDGNKTLFVETVDRYTEESIKCHGTESGVVIK